MCVPFAYGYQTVFKVTLLFIHRLFALKRLLDRQNVIIDVARSIAQIINFRDE